MISLLTPETSKKIFLKVLEQLLMLMEKCTKENSMTIKNMEKELFTGPTAKRSKERIKSA